MPAAKLDITIEQGATFSQSFIIKAGSPPVPVDLTGYTARMQIRPDVKSQTIIASASTTDGKIIIEPIDGKLTITFEATETASFVGDSGRYDLEIESPSGFVTRLIQGKVKISPEVTR